MLLQLKGLTKNFSDNGRKTEAVRDINLTLSNGDFVALIGPSGCGKTTLFDILAGLTPLDDGQIILDGKPVRDLRGQAGYMQQKDLLLPWRNAMDNALLPLEIKGTPRDKARRQAQALFAAFGLTGFESYYPRQLSGGMRQRVALVRTILCRKDIYLLDEPFGALDAITRVSMRKWLFKVWEEFRPAILLVTHDVEEALLLARHVYVFSSRPMTVKAEIDLSPGLARGTARRDILRQKEYILGLLEDSMEKSAS